MNPLLQPLGWLALEAAVVVLAALALQPLVRAAATRRSLWRAVLVALGLLLAAEFTGATGQLSAQFRTTWQTAFAKPAPPQLPPPLPVAFPIPDSPAPMPVFLPEPEPLPDFTALPPDPLPPARFPILPPVPTPAPVPLWPAWLWLAGLAALLVRSAWTHAGFAWLRVRHFLPAAEALRERVQALAARLGLRRRVRVLASERLRAPAAFGWLRPGVGVPGDFTDRFAPAQQDVMLAHELAHLAARDPLWQLLADLVAAALWWHPLAWVARRQHRLAGELAADDASLALPDGPVVLAECLLALGHEAADCPRAALGMAGFRSQLGRRVERLLALPRRDWQAPSRARLALQTAVALLALAALALLPGCAANRSAGEAPSSIVAKWWQAKDKKPEPPRTAAKEGIVETQDFGTTIFRLFNERRQPTWSPNSPARLAELENQIAATIAAEVARLRAEFTAASAKLPTDLELLRKHLEKVNQSLKQLVRAANTNTLESDQRHLDVMQRYREGVENTIKVHELDRAIPRFATQGRVLFHGPAPAERDIPLPAPVLAARANTPLQTRLHRVSPDGGLADVLVYVKHGLEGRNFPSRTNTHVIRIRGYEYHPYITAVQAGQPIRWESDVDLNFHPTPTNRANREFNRVLTPDRPVEATFSAPELFLRTKDDVHPWLFGYVSVLPHPYFAVTDADGRFRFPQPLPPGKYTLAAVHRQTGEVVRELDLTQPAPAGQPPEVEFVLSTKVFASYVVAVGDRLRVEVYKRDDLRIDARVQPDGTILLPLIKAVPVAGKTIAETRDAIRSAYEPAHLETAHVTVTLVQSAPPLAPPPLLSTPKQASDFTPSKPPTREELLERKARVEAEIKEAEKLYRPSHPKMIGLRKQLESVNEALKQAVSSVTNALDLSVGRQLFVDDFLIASNSLQRIWHKPAFFTDTPLVKLPAALTPPGPLPVCDRVWYDATNQLFKMRFATTNGIVAVFHSASGTNWIRGETNATDPALRFPLAGPLAGYATRYESISFNLYDSVLHSGLWANFSRRSGPDRTAQLLGEGPFIPAPMVPVGAKWQEAYPAPDAFLVVGRNLYFYFGGQITLPGERQTQAAVGLATLRRDGFASLDAGPEAGVLTTKPVTFTGRFMFVNLKTNAPDGELRIEILHPDGRPIELTKNDTKERTFPFSLANTIPLAADQTLMGVSWQNGMQDLSMLVGRPVRFRFHLKNASLYSFWVGPGQLGRSMGRVAGGGPHFTSDVDTIGNRSYQPFPRSTNAAPVLPPKPGALAVGDYLRTEVTYRQGTTNHTLRLGGRVAPAGYLPLPRVTRAVVVAGKTIEEARESIRQGFLAAGLENPVVTLTKTDPPPAAPTPAPSTNAPAAIVHHQPTVEKLARIRIPELIYDGLSLSEVLKFLEADTKRYDPAKRGISFGMRNTNTMDELASYYPPPKHSATNQPIYIGTGTVSVSLTANVPLPRTRVRQQALEYMETTAIKVTSVLRDVSVLDALDAIVKHAEAPIDFTIETNRVVFHPGKFTEPGRPFVSPQLAQAAAPPASGKWTPAQRAILQRLDAVVFPEIVYDGLPLPEVVKMLQADARKFDPEKKGFNFLINSAVQPLEAPARIDLNTVLIKVTSVFRGLTLAQVLDLVCKTASEPIQFVVEDYGIVFTPRARGQPFVAPRLVERPAGVWTPAQRALLQRLDTVVFPEIFYDGLPLPEVVKWLETDGRKHDPEKRGFNFLVNSTGQPGDAATQVELDVVLIHVTSVLKGLTLSQVLDVVCKTADVRRPDGRNGGLQFVVEDYGIIFTPRDIAKPFVAPRLAEQPAGAAVRAKLDKIVIPQVVFDGLPLPEVLKLLAQDARRHDPDKQGINLLTTRFFPDPPRVEPPDLDTVIINVPQVLNGLTLAQVLDVVCKTATRPITYRVEDYGVLITPDYTRGQAPKPPAPPAPPQPLPADPAKAREHGDRLEALVKTLRANAATTAQDFANVAGLIEQALTEHAAALKADAPEFARLKKLLDETKLLVKPRADNAPVPAAAKLAALRRAEQIAELEKRRLKQEEDYKRRGLDPAGHHPGMIDYNSLIQALRRRGLEADPQPVPKPGPSLQPAPAPVVADVRIPVSSETPESAVAVAKAEGRMRGATTNVAAANPSPRPFSLAPQWARDPEGAASLLPAIRAAVQQQIAAGTLGEPVQETVPVSNGEAARTATVQVTVVRPVAADVRRLTSPQTPDAKPQTPTASQSLLTSAATNKVAAPDPLQAAQEEALRRQERKVALDKLLGEAGQFLKVKSWTNAVMRYEEAIGHAKLLGGVAAMEKQYRDALAGLTHCRIQLAIELQEKHEFKAAAAEADKIFAFDPKNAEAEQFKRFNERVEAAHKGRLPDPQAPARRTELLEARSRVMGLVRDGKLFYEVGEYQEARKRLEEALALDPANDAAYYYLRLALESQFEFEGRPPPRGRIVGKTNQWNVSPRPNALPVPNPYAKTNSEVPFLTHSSKGAQRINRKLDEIVLPEVHFDGVPLAEVVKRLSADAVKFDPEPDPKKKGLNLLINDAAPPAPLLDASGNPVPVAQPVALSEGLIRLNTTMRNLTLRQVLDVICKTAELPTQFSVEEYAIAFIPRGPVAYYSRMFRVNPDTFMQGLQGVVGSPVLGVAPGTGNQPGAAGQNQPATTTTTTGPVRATVPATVPATQRTAAEANALVRQFFQSAGVTSLGATNGSTRVFFNPENGLLIARGTTNDLRVIEQAIQKVQPPALTPTSTNAPTSLPPGVRGYYRTNSDVPFLTHSSKGAQRINAKLDEIIVPEVRFDSVTLPEVVKWLDVAAKKFDPEKKGLNFLINNVASDYISLNATSAPAAHVLDPKGNLIATSTARQYPDLDIALVNVTKPLKNLTLRQVLDVICKTADVKMPDGRTAGLKFSIEEYAITFSPKLPERASLFPRMFKVDPEHFVRGLASVTPDEKLAKLGGRAEIDRLLRDKTWTNAPANVTAWQFRVAGVPITGQGQSGVSGAVNTNLTAELNNLLRDYFRAAGVTSLGATNGPDATQVFFNDRNGLLLVRASLQDLDIIQQAVELLNAKPPQVLIEAKFVEMNQNDNKAVGFDWFLGNTVVGDPSPGNRPSTVNPTGVFPQPASAGSVTNKLARTNAVGLATLTGVLTAPQFAVVLRALEQRDAASVRSLPKVTTPSGKQAVIELPAAAKAEGDLAQGLKLEVVPSVDANGYTISCSLIVTRDGKQVFESKFIVWDAQTVMLGFPGAIGGGTNRVPVLGDLPLAGRLFQPPAATNTPGRFLLFVTPTLVDPVGNRIHRTDEEMPFAPVVTPQPVPGKK